MLDGRFTHGTPEEMAAKQRLALPPQFRDRITMSTAEVAALLGRSETFVRELCRQKHFLFKTHNRRLLIDVQSVLDFLDTAYVGEIFFYED